MADPFDYKHRDNSYGEFSEEKLIRQARDFVLFCFYLSKNSKSLFFITKSNRLNSVVNDLTSAFKKYVYIVPGMVIDLSRRPHSTVK